MQEREIIALMRDRDERGMEALLKHYGALMRYIIAPILPSPQDREECLSEAAMRAWDRIDLYAPERGTWIAWLTALTRNAALNRSRQIRRTNGAKDLPPQIPSPEPVPEDAVLQRERGEAVNRALNRLSHEEKLLFYRKYYYLQPVAQIASELGITERAVEGRLYRLKKQLRKALGGEGHE